MLIAAVDVEGPGDGPFLQAAKAISESVIATIGIEGLAASEKLVGAHFARVNDIDVSILPSHFATAPKPLRIIKCNGTFFFAHITGRE
jgi:hypothetical protein